MGQFLTRKRRFHTAVRWITESLIKDAEEWEWIHWDIVVKESVAHSIGLDNPAGTTYRMAVMNRVWMNAGQAWKYTLEDLGCAHSSSREAYGSDQVQPWQSNKKPKKGQSEEDKDGTSKWSDKKGQHSHREKGEEKSSSSYTKWQSNSWSSRNSHHPSKPYHKKQEEEKGAPSKHGDGEDTRQPSRSAGWRPKGEDQWKKDGWKGTEGWKKNEDWKAGKWQKDAARGKGNSKGRGKGSGGSRW